MKYDPVELMKLNITEADIQRQRDWLLEGLANHPEGTGSLKFFTNKIWLPFIIDMIDDYDFSVEHGYNTLSIIIKLNR